MNKNILKDYRFILASASPRRASLVRLLGIEPEILPTEADETVPGNVTAPEDIVKILSERKAKAAFDSAGISGQTIILGSDTIVVKDWEILGKPKDKYDAERMLSLLEDDSHTVYTGIFLILADADINTGTKTSKYIKSTLAASEATGVHITHIPHDDMIEYIESGEPMDKAGAYGIQGPFARFTDRIEGEYSNVVGLPLSLLNRSLDELIR